MNACLCVLGNGACLVVCLCLLVFGCGRFERGMKPWLDTNENRQLFHSVFVKYISSQPWSCRKAAAAFRQRLAK